MNQSAIRKIVGFRVKLRPMALRWNTGGKLLPVIDDIWEIQMTPRRKAVIQINNLRTSHFWDLSADSIHDFRVAVVDRSIDLEKQGVLKLLGFVWLRGDDAGFEPLSLPVAEGLFLQQIGL